MKRLRVIIVLFVLLVSVLAVSASNPGRTGVKIILLNQDPDPVESGDVVEIRFKIENRAGATNEDLFVEILPQYPFSLYTGSAIEKVGKLRAIETGADAAIIDYKLRVDDDAEEGDNEIKLRYKFGESGYWIKVEDIFIDVEVEKVNFQIGSLETEPIRLVADTEDAKLSVELQNIGEENAKNVVIKLDFPEGFTPTYGYSDESKLGTIEGESSKTANFYVDVDEDLQEGDYEATLTINYKEEDDEKNEYKTKIIPLRIPLQATPLFEILKVETLPEIVRPGDDVELKLVIKNSGTKKAESVSIKAFKEASQPFEFDEKSDFIGMLKPGETGEAVLKFIVENDATAKKYLLDIEIRTINKENVLVFEKTVPFEVLNGKKSAFFGIKGLLSLAFVMVVVIIGLIAHRKRKAKQ